MEKQRHTILLTGGTGYLGSRFILHPISSQYHIRAGVRSGEIAKHLSLSFVTPFVLRPENDFSSLLHDVNVVVHFAGLTPHTKPIPTEEEFITINRDWTRRIAEACTLRNVAFVFISTAALYPDADGKPLTEDMILESSDLEDPYARSKREAETDLMTLTASGLQLSILRFGSVFGSAPSAIAQTRLNTFVRKACAHIPLTVFRSLWEERRPYTHIKDALDAIYFVIEHNAWSNHALHVVTENATTREIVTHVQQAIPDSHVEERADDIPMRSFGFDDTRIRRLGYRPNGSTEEGIKELIRAYRVPDAL